MFYKTGIDKFLLRSGKILGISATILIFYQLVFISRFATLEKVFKMKSLFQSHRTNGLIILAAAVLHPVFILGADHFVFFQFELKYWPEITGIILLSILILFVLISHWQKKLKLDYKLWRLLHKFFAPIIIIVLYIHIVNVSKTFESGIPFYALTFIFLLSLILIVRKCLK
jgi:predicted ferric reductase